MTQDGRWKLKYNEVMSFMEKEYRKLSKYYPKEKLMFHFIHHNRKLYNVGTMKEERKVLFEKLLVLCEKYKRIHQCPLKMDFVIFHNMELLIEFLESLVTQQTAVEDNICSIIFTFTNIGHPHTWSRKSCIVCGPNNAWIKIKDAQTDDERVVIKALSKCNINSYILFDTTYDEKGIVSNKFRHIFIFPDLVVEKGDFIWLYTKPGVYGTHTNTSGTTTHKLYWGVLSHIWNNDGDKAYLMHYDDWENFSYEVNQRKIEMLKLILF